MGLRDMDTNELVRKIANRIAEIGNISLENMRRSRTRAKSKMSAYRHSRGMDRGQLLEAVILDEFLEERPRKIANV
jgi:adenylate kinase family enzyme